MSVAANRYARALLDVLFPEKAEAGRLQLESLLALLKEEDDARRFFESPASGDRRKRLSKEIAEALGFDRRVANFVNLLIDRNRMELLEEITVAYGKFLDDRLGIVHARVTVAHSLDKAAESELAAKLEQLTGKQVRMEVALDPSLIGGAIAQVGSTIYDGSVRQQLQVFKSRLVEE